MHKGEDRQGLLLGKQVGVVDNYAPELLYPIPRERARDSLGIRGAALPFHGEDIWHAYELSWLDASGKPQVAVGRLAIPATSPNLVESKSLKLYLNSLNSTGFASWTDVTQIVARDVGEITGAPVSLELLLPGDASFSGRDAPGICIDDLPYVAVDGEPTTGQLGTGEGAPVEEILHSHLLRSLCPVTGQPDWATLVVSYRGKPLSRGSLLAYVIAFRRHQEFHEQCVERIYTDLVQVLEPERLAVQAFYTRRGGIDICPWRSSEAGRAPRYRLNRQ